MEGGGGGGRGEHSPLVCAIAVASQERLRELVATRNVLLQSRPIVHGVMGVLEFVCVEISEVKLFMYKHLQYCHFLVL